jgi:hypothetical protein
MACPIPDLFYAIKDSVEFTHAAKVCCHIERAAERTQLALVEAKPLRVFYSVK